MMIITRGNGNDQIMGTGDSDTINSNGGNDTINALGGDDIVNAGSGNDKVDAGDGYDTVHGNDGNDEILGGAGNDTLYGDAGNDKLDGGSGDDSVYGGTGNDTLSYKLAENAGNHDLYDGGTNNKDIDVLNLILTTNEYNTYLSQIQAYQTFLNQGHHNELFTFNFNQTFLDVINIEKLVITIQNPPNSPPVADNVSASGLEDPALGYIPITLTGSDPDGNFASFSLSSLPAHGSLYTDPSLNQNSLVLLNTSYNSSGNLTLYFQPDENFNAINANDVTFSYTATDTNGLISPLAIATIGVNAVNDAPVVVNNTTSLDPINEDGALGGFGGAQVVSLFGSINNFSDAADQVTGGSSADLFAGIAISDYTVDATKGSWQYSTDNTTWTPLISASLAAAITLNATDYLRFVPAADYNGSATTLSAHLIESGFTFPIGDPNQNTIDLTNATGGSSFISDATVALNETINSVNDAPDGTNGIVSTDANQAHAFTVGEFGFTDPHDTNPANTFDSVFITNFSGAGSLTINGTAVTTDPISVTDIQAGHLVFTPDPNTAGASYASFDFQVVDNGGTDLGGINTDPLANQMTINVAKIPLFTPDNDTVNFNTIVPAIYTDVPNAYYDALGGNDIVTLPSIITANSIGYIFAHTFFGNAGDDNITGNNGNDIIDGGLGNDTITGGAGIDTIDGGGGNDNLDGGLGSDTVSYASAPSTGLGVGVTVSLAALGPQNTVTAGTDTLVGFEHLTGSDFADTLIGSNNFDTILGGNGNDSITGGLGGDQLNGQDGNDSFIYNSFDESKGFGGDTITSFTSSDQLLLDSGAFNGSTISGGLESGRFDTVAVNSDVHLADSNAMYIYVTNNNLLYYDATAGVHDVSNPDDTAVFIQFTGPGTSFDQSDIRFF